MPAVSPLDRTDAGYQHVRMYGASIADQSRVFRQRKTSERAFEFGCHLIDEFRRGRAVDDAERLIWKELLKAGTSVGANASESDGAQSSGDFIAKFQIALKEGKESLFWLRLLKHARP